MAKLEVQVQLAASKNDLLVDSHIENRQTFSTPPTLGALKQLLHVICEELKTYELWPVRSKASETTSYLSQPSLIRV